MAVTRNKRRGKSGEGAGWRRSPITGFVAFLIIVVCLYNIFFSGQSSSGTFKNDYVCQDCRKVQRLALDDRKGKAPYVCPECSKLALYTALHCNPCNKVTASLEPLRDFTCTSCGHHETARLDVTKVPLNCTKCSKPTFYETYECMSCKHVFGYKKVTHVPTEGQDSPEMMGEMSEIVPCPKCKKTEAYRFLEATPTCEFCNANDLKAITPVAVIKWELGRELNSTEKKEVEDWKKNRP